MAIRYVASQMSTFRDYLHVNAMKGERFDLALDLLSSGEVFVFRGIALAIRNGTLEVDVPSAHRSGRILEEDVANDELNAAVETVALLARSPQRFHSIAGDLPRRCVLIDDYGNGAVALAELEGGILRWRSGTDPPAQ